MELLRTKLQYLPPTRVPVVGGMEKPSGPCAPCADSSAGVRTLGAPARAPNPITVSPAQPELCTQSTYLLSHLPRGDHPSEKRLEEPLPEPHPCRFPSHPGLHAPGHSLSSSLRQEGPQIWREEHSQCSRVSQPGQGWVHTPPGASLLLGEAQKDGWLHT